MLLKLLPFKHWHGKPSPRHQGKRAVTVTAAPAQAKPPGKYLQIGVLLSGLLTETDKNASSSAFKLRSPRQDLPQPPALLEYLLCWRRGWVRTDPSCSLLGSRLALAAPSSQLEPGLGAQTELKRSPKTKGLGLWGRGPGEAGWGDEGPW